MGRLEFDGDLPVTFSGDNTPYHGRAKGDVVYRRGGREKGGASNITAIIGRNGEKMDLLQVSKVESAKFGIHNNFIVVSYC